MGLVSMSERDLRRIEVLSEVRTGRRTVAAAAAVLAVSERQACRLLPRYEVNDGSGLIHRARPDVEPKPDERIRKYAVELVKTRYADFGRRWQLKCFWTNMSASRRETLRRWMTAGGLWLSRTQRRTFHQLGLRCESYGFNHTSFGLPDASPTGGTYGQVTSVGSVVPRVMQAWP
jgi:hypothetical protein